MSNFKVVTYMFQKSANLPVIVNILVDMYFKQVAPTEEEFKREFDVGLSEHKKARNKVSRAIQRNRMAELNSVDGVAE